MPKNSNPIEAVLFDYGMVLSGAPDPAAWTTLRNTFNAPEDRFHAAYWRYRTDYDRGTLSADLYWHAIAVDLARPFDDHTRNALIAADTTLWTQPNQPMLDWAADLQRAGIKTGILSNLGDAMELGVLARFPQLQAFTHHTFSHRLHLVKPDREIYLHAAEGLATPPSRILFIDDREENIEGARVAGMQAIQYTTHDALITAMHDQNLSGLLELTPQLAVQS